MGKETNKKNQKINEEFISLSQAAKRSGYTPEHLNLSARKGKLQAQKIGRNWYTTEEWLDAFLSLAMSRRNEKSTGELISVPAEESVLVSENQQTEEAGEKIVAEKIIEEISASPAASEKKSIRNIFPKNWLQAVAGVSAMIVIAPIIFFSVYSVKYYAAQKSNEAKKIALINGAPSEIIVNENGDYIYSENSEAQVLGVVSGEATADPEAEKKSGTVLASENFKAQNVSMGMGIVLASAEENQPLEISDIKSESFITGKKSGAGSEEEVKMVVSWKTNKLAMSELAFSKNNGQDQKVLKEQSFGFNHAVVLTQIDPRTSYVYQVKGKDHWGNETDSDFYGIFTTSKPVSVFDLISEQINQIFGWAMKE